MVGGHEQRRRVGTPRLASFGDSDLEPYVSPEDIDKGARWNTDISQELEGSSFGILCITADNVEAPWINFEAGALSKSLEQARVAPFLFGVQRTDVTGPLLQFQSTIYEHDDVLKLVRSLNAACDHGLDDGRLDEVFEVWWPKLEERLDQVTTARPTSKSATRTTPDLITEVLELVRAQQGMLFELSEGRPRGGGALEATADRWSLIRLMMRDEECPPAFMRALQDLGDPLEYMFDRAGLAYERPSADARARRMLQQRRAASERRATDGDAETAEKGR